MSGELLIIPDSTGAPGGGRVVVWRWVRLHRGVKLALSAVVSDPSGILARKGDIPRVRTCRWWSERIRGELIFETAIPHSR